MEMITNPQLSCIHAMIAKLKLTEHKTALVVSFSNGRVESSKELTKGEATLLIKHLKSHDDDEKKAEAMRRKIISRAHEMGWRIPHTERANMMRVDGWCLEYGYLNKNLNSYTVKELPKLVTQFDAVYKSYLKTL